MQNTDIKKSVRAWLEKSGYPLEMYVHQIALKRGYLCEKSQLYSDIETGISREIDLIAYLHSPAQCEYLFELNLVIECKKSEKPILVLCDGKSNERYRHLLGHELVNDLKLNTGAAYFNLHDMEEKELKTAIGRFSEITMAGYSLVSAFGKSDENLYKGLMGLAKAEEYFRSEYHKIAAEDKASKEPMENDWFRLQLPVMVVDAPIFTVHLQDDGELKITESEWASILVRLPWTVDRTDAQRLCNIQIVQKEYFGEFLTIVEKFRDFISLKEIAYFKENV